MALTVIGIFDNAQEAQQAVEKLTSEGFSRSNIDLSARTGSYADSQPTTTGGVFPDQHQNTSGTRTEEMADDAKDVGNGIGNFFKSIFGDDDDDDRDKYARVADERSVVTVHTSTDSEAERAADMLDEAGAIDVNERAAQYGYTGAAAGTVTGTQPVATDNDQTIKVIEEKFEVGKRTVETGGVRLRSRIVSKPVEEHVRLREERVHVQRTPVSRLATAADLNAFQDGEITLTEQAEVPVVSKTAHVVEEISVGKNVTERDETIRDTVRRTDVEVEPLVATESSVRTDRTGLNSDDTIDTAK